MSRRSFIAVVMVILAGLAIGAASGQATTPTRHRLWTAMDNYAQWRHVGGGIPSATPAP